jgi:hypothetical protein
LSRLLAAKPVSARYLTHIGKISKAIPQHKSRPAFVSLPSVHIVYAEAPTLLFSPLKYMAASTNKHARQLLFSGGLKSETNLVKAHRLTSVALSPLIAAARETNNKKRTRAFLLLV